MEEEQKEKERKEKRGERRKPTAYPDGRKRDKGIREGGKEGVPEIMLCNESELGCYVKGGGKARKE